MPDKDKRRSVSPDHARRMGRAGPSISVTVQLSAKLKDAVDAWAGEHAVATRADAIVSLIEKTLGTDDNAPLRDRAADLAGQQIDRMGDATASAEERELRKSRLTKGPSAFRDVRRDRPRSNE